MIRFESDYQEGCHPNILKMLADTNLEQTSGYGEDAHCERAKNLIKKSLKLDGAEIHFLVGGTQTNAIIIKSLLSPFEGVICLGGGHINVHEAGAIESTGHKVLAINSGDEGLLLPEDLENYLKNFYDDPTHEHMVQPGMVYISHPAETGTLYKKANLKKIKNICEKYELYLFIDGARLGYGVMADNNDLSVNDIAKLCDVFYIGGTKVGALFGEAVVIPEPEKLKLKNKNFKNFRTIIKQNGGLLAKGRLLGIQFEALFDEDELYFKIAEHADIQAMRIKKAFEERGIKMLYNSHTNQQFPVLNNEQRDYLSKNFIFELWQPLDEHKSAYRFCTSWCTSEKAVDGLIEQIKNLKN